MKPARKSLLRQLLNLVILGGAVLAVWPLGQTAFGWWSQRSLQSAWQREAKQAIDATSQPQRSAAAKKGKPLKASLRRVSTRTTRVTPKWPLTRLIIPDISVDVVVVGGTDDESLRQGPGFVSGSAMPGEGNCVIAGHRNVYGSWLYRVDELWPESVIKLRTPHHTYTYHVSTVTKVSEADTSVLQAPSSPDATPVLTLITCTLPHTSDRVVVSAYLVTEPST